MAQIPEYSQLSAAAQALVQQGYTFEAASLIASQQTGQTVQTREPRVEVVDRRMGRSPGPGQLPQFAALPAQAQQNVIDRGMTFAQAKAIEDDIAAAPDPVVARKRRQSFD